MNANKIKLLNCILFLNFIIYISSNLIILKYSPSTIYSIFTLCIRDIIIFLFSIFLYMYFCNPQVGTIILSPKINNKIVKNSIIIGILFYFIASGMNLIFTNIFGFTLKNAVYLNSIYDTYNLGIGFIFYIIIYTILVEIFFRVILNDAFKFLSYKVKLILCSFIFSIFFFGLSQIFYGFIVGILLMSFLNKVGNIGPVIIASTVINILNYLVRLIGENFMNNGFVRSVVFMKKDVFIDFIFPIIVILLASIIVCIVLDRTKVNTKLKKVSNVTELNFNVGIKNVVDIYFLLFIVFSFLMLFISYIFL